MLERYQNRIEWGDDKPLKSTRELATKMCRQLSAKEGHAGPSGVVLSREAIQGMEHMINILIEERNGLLCAVMIPPFLLFHNMASPIPEA